MHLARVVHNSAALLVVDLLAKLMPLVTFPLIVRALGPEAYGKVAFAAAVCGFFGIASAPGFTTVGAREIARHPEDARTTTARIQGARVLLSVAAYALLVVLTMTLAPHDFTTRVLLLLAGINFVVSSLDLQWLFLGSSRMWPITMAAVAGQVIYFALIVVLVRTPHDAWVVPAAVAAASFTTAVILVAAARHAYSLSWPRFAFHEWRGLVPACVTLGLASVMTLIYDQIDTVMLRYMRGEAEVGLYAATYKIMAVSLSFLPIIVRVFFPLLSESAAADPGREKRYLSWMAAGTLGAAVPITVGGMLLAEPLTGFLLGRQYTGSESLLRWLMLNVMAGALAAYYGSRLVPRDRERLYLRAVGAGALVNVALNAVFIPQYGAIAAVSSTIASQLVVAAVALYYGRDLPQVPLHSPFRDSLVASGVMALGIWAAQGRGVHVVVVVLCGAVLYLATYWGLNRRVAWRARAAGGGA